MKIKLCCPEIFAVYQRNESNEAHIPISGRISAPFQKLNLIIKCRPFTLENFLSPRSSPPEFSDWLNVEFDPHTKKLSGEIILPAGGWYGLELSFNMNDKEIAKHIVRPFGVGELIITGGQSNSANSGNEKLSPASDKVVAWDPKPKGSPNHWRLAKDPQPFTNGTGGTPWPAMADLLLDSLKVPIGLISIGVGGTRVDQWLPGEKLYPRIKTAVQKAGLNGARVFLWHQGESDTIAKTSTSIYVQRLLTVIHESQHDAGWSLPWMIAKVGFHPNTVEEDQQAIVAGQNSIVDRETIFEGPTTDDLLGSEWRFDNVHFNGKGLREHGKRWADLILQTFFS